MLIVGAAGQVGSALRALVPDATAVTRAHLDLADLDAIAPAFREINPSAVVNCAAYTAVDRAEEQPELARTINALAVERMAEVCGELGIPFVTYSTDYVFPGTGTEPYVESDPVDPVNAYGRSKLDGERLALGVNKRSLVIRTSWVISGTHPNFVATMLRLAVDRTLKVVDDQVGCPTIATDLAASTLEAMQAGATGLLHRTNQGSTTWYRLARAAVALAGLDPERVRPCSTEEYPTPARRPAYSVLASERASSFGLANLPPWEASLRAVVRELRGGPSC